MAEIIHDINTKIITIVCATEKEFYQKAFEIRAYYPNIKENDE